MIRGKFQKRERAGNESFRCNDGFHTTFRMFECHTSDPCLDSNPFRGNAS